nr:DUF1801 domain-containing protein [uncultured Carboxylicivirga sp.]
MKNLLRFKTVDEYFYSQPIQVREVLLELRSYIFTAEPNAIEVINYNIPAYSLVEGGKRDQQIMIAGYKKHVGLYPHPSVMDKFSNELSNYKKGKGSVQFPIDQSLPKQLIVKMVKYRVELIKKGQV